MPSGRVSLADVLRAADESGTGALWKLDGAARQLDANLVRLRPGTVVAEHVEPDLDVLLVVIEGDGVAPAHAARRSNSLPVPWCSSRAANDAP